MIIDLVLFYNLSGVAMCVLALLMFAVRKQSGNDGSQFNAAKSYLSVMFVLSGLSMFAAQFDKGIGQNRFEILNVVMLLFFFLICQGFLLSFHILYASRFARKQILNRAFLPVLFLFGVYSIAYFFMGDEPFFTTNDFLRRLPDEPLLMFRCFLLMAVALSLLYSIRLCHLAKKDYNRLISGYFSETDFSRSVWLSNLLGSGEALAVWVFLTYFYTTPVLEVVVGGYMMVVFAFYVKEFHEYEKRYERFKPALLLSVVDRGEQLVADETGVNVLPIEESEEDYRCAALLATWKERPDKPFTKQGLTISDVAKELNIPRYRISGYVNRGDQNFCSWINDLRIQEGARLLQEERNLSISDIAERTGFCDLPAFSRAFKKANNVSPSVYRNKVGLDENQPDGIE